MNIEEIRKIYVEKLTEICTGCFNRIDSFLIYEYNTILKHKPAEIYIYRVYSDYDGSPYFEDIIIKIQQHYSENWEVSFNEKSKNIIFLYKNDLTEILRNPKEIKTVVETKVEVEIKEPEEKNRFDLMDVEE